MKLLTDQEAFDKVVTHLLSQNEKCWIPDQEVCLYRGDGGLMCAVGCLIPDEEYHTSMEKQGVYQLFDRLEGPPKSISNLNQYLLGILQSVHDDEEPEHWEHYLKKTAMREGLTYKGRKIELEEILSY